MTFFLKLEGRWNELERPYNSPPFFYTWFLKHCRDTITKNMLPDIRIKAGLGCPPMPYYTNEVESKNKILEDEVEHKSSELPDFINKMRGLLKEQRHEVECALINTGKYRLKDEYRYLQVESSSWFKMTLDQCQRKISCFMKAPVEVSSNRISPTENPINTLNLPKKHKRLHVGKSSGPGQG